MAWWQSEKLRMIQNNLRDIDADMDVSQYVRRLKEFGANACMVGCGGITSFYPSQLDCQTPSPYLKGDFFGRLVEECHAEDIKVIARFDFSKAHEGFYQTHPEWFSLSTSGSPIFYHDTAATCVNGEYQQKCSIEILKEALSLYPVDGVFFNMFGYQTYDYAGNYVGICQCENCRERFFARTGYPLPQEENQEDFVFQEYLKFKKETVNELLQRIQEFVHRKYPDVAVCTYNLDGVDLVRNESNSAVDRPLPFWIYQSEYHVSVVQNSFADKIASNCVINAVDIPYRFMGVSKYQNQIRLYGNMAAGGMLDWCIIGSFEDYPDRDNFEGVKEVFAFHQKHIRYYSQLKSCAKILLITEQAFNIQRPENHECLGIYKMLKESHLLFDLLEISQLESKNLENYEWIILPGTQKLSSQQCDYLQKSKAHILATGLTLENQPGRLKDWFGVTLGEKIEAVRGSYMEVSPKSIFTSFKNRDWVYLDLQSRPIICEKENGVLPFLPARRYGPPERCYGYERSQDAMACIREKTIYLSWMPGTLYYRHGYEDFKNILLDLMQYNYKTKDSIKCNLPEQAEVFFDCVGEKKYLLQILNLSGFNGMTFFAPIPLSDVEVVFPNLSVGKIIRLTADGEEQYPFSDRLRINKINLYEAFIIEETEE